MELLIPIIVLAAMWFFMSRSTKKQQQERQNTLSAMKAGDNVVTIGGLHGVLSEVNDKTVIIDCEGIYLEFDKAAIKSVTPGTAIHTEDAVAEVEENEAAEATKVEAPEAPVDAPSETTDTDTTEQKD